MQGWWSADSGRAFGRPPREAFFQELASSHASGCFRGGSEVGQRIVLGNTQSAESTRHVVGYMRFDADDKPNLLELLQTHPVVRHGGSVELCELPKS